MTINQCAMKTSLLKKHSFSSHRMLITRVLEAVAEAVGLVSRFQIGGWDSY